MCASTTTAGTWCWRCGVVPRLTRDGGKDLAGLLWLLGSTACTIACGWTLQVLAIHRLGDLEYSSFVFALAIGSIAAILGGAIQPVVAASAMKGEGSWLSASAAPLAGAIAALTGALILVTAPAVGFAIAILSIVQLPIHLAVGVVSGWLQARRAYRALSIAALCWTGARILLALGAPLFLSSAVAFLLALPAALAVQFACLAIAHHQAGSLRESRQAPVAVPWGMLLAWCAIGWIVYGDGVMARLVLGPSAAADYALALTLGRQAIYVATPVATVILPIAATSGLAGRRRLFLATIGAMGCMFGGLWLALGTFPGETVKLVLLNPSYESLTAVRLYALIGTVSFGALLLASLLTGSGAGIRAAPLAAIAVLSTATMAWLTDSPGSMAVVQLMAVAAAGVLILQQCAANVWHRYKTSPGSSEWASAPVPGA